MVPDESSEPIDDSTAPEGKTQEEEEDDERTGPSLPKKLFFVLVASVLLLLLCEGVLRIAGLPSGRVRTLSKVWNTDRESYDESIGVFRPGAKATISWPVELTYTVEINSLGLRGPEVSLEKPEGTFRILCLGDSTTFGYYVEQDGTYPRLLEGMLNERSQTPIEVINAGCGKWCLADEAPFLKERAIRLDPDLVLLTICANDVPDLYREPTLYEEQKKELAHPSLLRNAWHGSALFEFLLLGQIWLKKAREGTPNLLATFDPADIDASGFDDEKFEPYWKEHEKYLKQIRDTVEKHGARLAVTYFPDPLLVRGHVDGGFLKRHRTICERLGIPFFTALERFRANDEPGVLYFEPIDFHTTKRGNELVAEAARDFLEENGYLP